MKSNKKFFMSKTLTIAVAIGLLAPMVLSSKPVSASEEVIVDSNFENGTDGWINIGNCNLMTAGWTKNSGNQSLYVGSREKNWSGALYALGNKVQEGNTYKVSSHWMSWQIHNTENVKLTLVYKDKSGNIKNACIGENTAPSGQWTNLSGTFTIPKGASDTALYFETTKNAYDYYLDDIKITKVSGSNQTPTTTPDKNPNNGQSISMKDISNIYMSHININVNCPFENLIKRNNVKYGTFEHKTYYSSTTKSNRGFNILLPPNYNPEKKYPVLYVLHGIMENEFSLLNINIPEIVGNQIANGNAKEMIVVLPNIYASTNGASPSFTPESVEGYNNFVKDLENDLMPYIKNHYSVSTDRKHQAIAGFSMGGRQALYIGLTRSNLFGYVMGIAPAPGLTPGQDWAMTHPGQLQESQLKIANPENTPYAIMICGGTNDNVVGGFPESYHNILTRNNQNHIWYTVPGGAHDNITITSGLNNFVGAIFHAD